MSESLKRAMGSGGFRVTAYLRPSRMANNSAVSMEAVGGNLQAMARDLEGT